MAPASTLRSRIALASILGLASFALTTSDANAYSVKKTTKGELVHWEVDRVAFTIDPSVEANVATAEEATKVAMQSWSGTVGAPDIQVAKLDASSPTAPTFDRKNGVFFMPGGYEPAGRALAITVLTYDNASGKILDADVVFNGAYAFEVLPHEGTTKTTKGAALVGDVVEHDEHDAGDLSLVYDLHHVVAHELGHSLGMNDEMGVHDALMYRYTAPNDPSIREPADDDITGLSELYANNAPADANGCGSATVAPKNPSRSASNVAMVATLGLLLFLVLRAKSDRRARAAFVLAAAAGCVALMPNLSGKGVARASETSGALSLGHARAHVSSTSTVIEKGLFKTTFELATVSCRTNLCPKAGHGVTWGGTVGNITQEVGGYYAPATGADVDVSFKKLPNAFDPIARPLAGRAGADTTQIAEVKVITAAR
ncbi:MAG: matrixin family metalloprotease [Labilithrix sp.]|nr:matrixin family metalloprotease [Labilithrix sp.]MCW5816095.1 matrixin family metalloprotease [Labilithrix sp.]